MSGEIDLNEEYKTKHDTYFIRPCQVGLAKLAVPLNAQQVEPVQKNVVSSALFCEEASSGAWWIEPAVRHRAA